MKCAALLALSCAAMCFPAVAPPTLRQEPERPALSASTVDLLDRMVGSSQQGWSESLGTARDALRADPRGVIEHLVGKLEVDEDVEGWLGESQTYNVCGNALTLLERLTDERICGLGRDWIGFSTHDHRSTRPSREKVQGPWQAWLRVRAELAVDEWFWGLSYAELSRVSRLMRRPHADWEPADLDAVRKLGRRAHPYLLDKLTDDEFAVEGAQFCTQANALLRRLTGLDLGEIERTELLRLDPEDPDRKYRLAVLRNEASRALMRRRWTSVLLAR